MGRKGRKTESDAIAVRLMPLDRLREAAVFAHSSGAPLRFAPNSQTIDRWTVNYARHRLTDYDRLHHGLNAQDVKRLRDRVLSAIAQTYPELADECRRQIDYRQDWPSQRPD
jgi:hypothetical protein